MFTETASMMLVLQHHVALASSTRTMSPTQPMVPMRLAATWCSTRAPCALGGFAKLVAVKYTLLDEVPDAEDPFYLTTVASSSNCTPAR